MVGVSGKHFPGPDFPLWKWEKLTHFTYLVKIDGQHFPLGNIIKKGKVNLNFIWNIIFNIFCHRFFFKWSIIECFKNSSYLWILYVFVWYSNKILEQNKRVVKIGLVFFYFGQVACIIVLSTAYLVGPYTLALWVNQWKSISICETHSWFLAHILVTIKSISIFEK